MYSKVRHTQFFVVFGIHSTAHLNPLIHSRSFQIGTRVFLLLLNDHRSRNKISSKLSVLMSLGQLRLLEMHHCSEAGQVSQKTLQQLVVVVVQVGGSSGSTEKERERETRTWSTGVQRVGSFVIGVRRKSPAGVPRRRSITEAPTKTTNERTGHQDEKKVIKREIW